MKFVAVMDKIFVKDLVVKEKKTEAGIILTEEAAQNQEPQMSGVIISFGADVPYDLNVGDVIVFHIRAGQAIIFDKEIYRIVKADEVYGILKNEDTCSDETLEDDEYPVNDKENKTTYYPDHVEQAWNDDCEKD